MFFENYFLIQRIIKWLHTSDEGSTRNEMWHWTNDEAGVAPQGWLWAQAELMTW